MHPLHTMTILMLATLAAYLLILGIVSFCNRSAKDNDAFFRAERKAPWAMVALGMVGASISGVSLVSVPGWVASTGMTYLQMCMGFVAGYLVVAFVLLPLYYRLRLTSIYAYLGERFGMRTRRTGALFFFLSKLTGASARLYLSVFVIAQFAHFRNAEVVLSVAVLIIIYLYTRARGLSTIVRTDALQTVCLVLAMVGILWAAIDALGTDLVGAWSMIVESPMSRVFEWDVGSKQAFWRQFLSGVFIVVVMTGLDQDMMQKNLSCRTLRDAQKNMCSYGLAFLPVNALLLALGILLYALLAARGLSLEGHPDALLPKLVAEGALGRWVVVPFTIGIAAAALSSADSALTALTTSFCIDILRIEERGMPRQRAERLRRITHIAMLAGVFLCMMIIRIAGTPNMIDTIYRMASYTYGPLLGLYAFGMTTRRPVRDGWVPAVCLAVPVACALLDIYSPQLFGYSFGYELLLVSGALTMLMLHLLLPPTGSSPSPARSR